MPEQTTSSTAAEGSPSAGQLYGADYYTHYWGGGGPYERNDQWLRFFGSVADGLIRDFHPTSVLDAGCAMGFLVEQLRKRGVEAGGFDISEFAISQVDESAAPYCRVASLTEPIDGRFDLVTCIEVLEHLPPEEADAAVANLCSATDLVVMSSTPGDYGEPTHLNVMQPEDWAVKFAQNGFYRDLDRDVSYLSPWTAVYVRRNEAQIETVRRYDRGWTRLRREANEVRASLLRVQAELTELSSLPKPEPTAEIQAELDSRSQEILRLRDLLIGMEQELGLARGQITQIEDRGKRIEGAKLRIEGKIPIVGKPVVKLLGLISRLLGRPI